MAAIDDDFGDFGGGSASGGDAFGAFGGSSMAAPSSAFQVNIL